MVRLTVFMHFISRQMEHSGMYCPEHTTILIVYLMRKSITEHMI